MHPDGKNNRLWNLTWRSFSNERLKLFDWRLASDVIPNLNQAFFKSCVEKY